jgi:hypothetical protein
MTTDAETLALVRKALALAHWPDDRLAWLSALLDDLIHSDWPERRKDFDGAAEALLECRRLLHGLEAAFARERRPRPGDVVPGAPDPGPDVLPY